MKRARSHLGGQFGALGAAGVALIAAGAAFLLFVVQPLEREHRRLAEQLSLAARGAAGPGAREPAAQLAAFYGFFRRDGGANESLAKLHGAARAAGLELRSADYRLVESSYPLLRYQISLPASGSYTQIRSFLGRALEAVPTLSIDRVGFRRQRTDSAQVEADISMTLYLARP